MADFNYNSAAIKAGRLIAKFGGDGTFTRETGGGVDPVTGDTSQVTTDSIAGTVTPVLNYRNDEINGESVLRSDGYVFFDGAPVRIGDNISINGEVWRAVDIQKIQSVDGVLVYQKVQLRL